VNSGPRLRKKLFSGLYSFPTRCADYASCC
jgi:hypothetical protein